MYHIAACLPSLLGYLSRTCRGWKWLGWPPIFRSSWDDKPPLPEDNEAHIGNQEAKRVWYRQHGKDSPDTFRQRLDEDHFLGAFAYDLYKVEEKGQSTRGNEEFWPGLANHVVAYSMLKSFRKKL